MTLPARKMSALGQKQTCAARQPMSAHCQKWTSRVRVYLTPMCLGREPQTCHQPRRYDCRVDDNMTLQIEPRHDLSPNEIDAIEDRLYDHNSYATGRHDGQSLAFVIRNEVGQMIGVAAGYTWSGTSELKQMWIDEAYRGRGYARALLNAFVAEACSRGVHRIWVASYDFQAPGLYEKAGFKRMAEFEGWPEGHMNVVKKSLFLLAVPRGVEPPTFGLGNQRRSLSPHDVT